MSAVLLALVAGFALVAIVVLGISIGAAAAADVGAWALASMALLWIALVALLAWAISPSNQQPRRRFPE